MGYYVNTEDINVVVPKDLIEPAYKAVLALQDRNDLKRGGSFGPGNERRYWFSWMPEDLSTLSDLKEVFTHLGFTDTDYNANGDLVLGRYDNKTGNEDIFCYVIAPFVQEGSYVYWRGEDDSYWKWEYRDGKMFAYGGEREIIWDTVSRDVMEDAISNNLAMEEYRKRLEEARNA